MVRLCVWVLVSVVESHHWEQSEGYFLMLQGRRWTGNSGRTLASKKGSQLQYQKNGIWTKRKGYSVFLCDRKSRRLSLFDLCSGVFPLSKIPKIWERCPKNCIFLRSFSWIVYYSNSIRIRYGDGLYMGMDYRRLAWSEKFQRSED